MADTVARCGEEVEAPVPEEVECAEAADLKPRVAEIEFSDLAAGEGAVEKEGVRVGGVAWSGCVWSDEECGGWREE